MIINIFICILASATIVEWLHILSNIYRYYKLRKVKHITTATIEKILRRP